MTPLNYMFAYLHHSPSPTVDRVLQVQDSEVGFLISSIKNFATFQTNPGNDEWSLRFFTGSEFEQTIAVSIRKNDNFTRKYLAKAAWFDNGDDVQNNALLEAAASQFARGSATLSVSGAMALTDDRAVLMDKKVCLYFSKSKDQFYRIVVCLALASAYELVLHQCLKEVTEHIRRNDKSKTLALYERILKFNAADYFGLPVLLDRHELSAAWDGISRHFRLNQLNGELTDQLSRVAALLRNEVDREQKRLDTERRDAERQAEIVRQTNEAQRLEVQRSAQAARLKQEKDRADTERRTELLRQQRDQKLAQRVTGWGLIIAVLSLFQLVQLTPQHFKDAYRNWGPTPAVAEVDTAPR